MYPVTEDVTVTPDPINFPIVTDGETAPLYLGASTLQARRTVVVLRGNSCFPCQHTPTNWDLADMNIYNAYYLSVICCSCTDSFASYLPVSCFPDGRLIHCVGGALSPHIPKYLGSQRLQREHSGHSGLVRIINVRHSGTRGWSHESFSSPSSE